MSAMADTVIYVHGRGGSAAEAELYRPLFPACEVIGFDYRAQTPWEAKDEFPALFAPFYEKSGRVFLIANSIGAFFSLHALDAERIEKAFLISPVADMAALVAGMMARAGVTEDALYEKRTVVTADGETLSWEYLEYVRAHPLEWRAPT
ncbi:MAG: alpha/beta hydrolase, partial [Oscillibacter sp.]|nr:alpha/beta hydrolase [Oscillibacter sp.]